MSILKVEELSVNYLFKGRNVKALNKVSFEVPEGNVTAILGESGSGKSTLAKAILRILPPNANILGGSIFFKDRDILKLPEDEIQEIRGKRISLIPQNALDALSPIHRIGVQLTDILRERMGMTKDQGLQRIKEVFRMVGLPEEVVNRYFFELSGGMKERVLIATSMLCNPDIIIADEPTTGLDAILQYRILRELKSLQKKTGLTVIFISHDIAACAYISNVVAVFYGGFLFEYGPSKEVFLNPVNPYTAMLLRSHTDIKKPRGEIVEIKGTPPNLLDPPSGCVFHPRCPYAEDICGKEEPPIRKVGQAHFTRCHIDFKEENIW